MKKKAFAYLRVSGKNQIKGNGFRRQLEIIEDYCHRHGYEIVDVFREEGVSGVKSAADRPAFQMMISTILKNGVCSVIIEGLDRLAREYRIQETLIIYLASKGIELLSARTEENITEAVMSDPMRKALVQVQGIFAELEKNMLVRKLRIAREHKKAQTGKCEGRHGYSDVAPEIVDEIRKLRRKSGNKKRLTYKQLAAIMNDKGFTSISGKPFTGPSVQMILQRLKKRK